MRNSRSDRAACGLFGIRTGSCETAVAKQTPVAITPAHRKPRSARREAAPVRDERCATRDALGLPAACLASYWVSAPKIANRHSRSRRLRKCPAPRFQNLKTLFMAPVDARAASPLCIVLGITAEKRFHGLFMVLMQRGEAARKLESPRLPSDEGASPCRGPAQLASVFTAFSWS